MIENEKNIEALSQTAQLIKSNAPILRKVLTIGIAMVWFINGFFCKVLNMVPRHRLIVAEILSTRHAAELTVTIGVMETALSILILSGIRSHKITLLQVLLIASMNILEFILVPDLLLFGRINIVFAFLFIMLVIYTESLKQTELFKK